MQSRLDTLSGNTIRTLAINAEYDAMNVSVLGARVIGVELNYELARSFPAAELRMKNVTVADWKKFTRSNERTRQKSKKN